MSNTQTNNTHNTGFSLYAKSDTQRMDNLFWLLLENRVEKGIGHVESGVIKMGEVEIQAAQEELP